MLDSAWLLLMNGFLFMLRISSADSFPRPLNASEEKNYLAAFESGDMAARNILIEHNLRLVAHIMKKYYAQADDADDLISIGTIGLIKGIDSYRAEKGVRLATYASRCIENEILMYFRSQKKSAGDMSLADALDVDGDGSGLSLIDVVAYEEDLSARVANQEICSCLRNCIDRVLTNREATVIRLRYGLDGSAPKTQRETAKICSISRSYVSRIEKKALEKLRQYLGEDANPNR